MPSVLLPDDRLASLRDLIARSREGEAAVQAYFTETMRELGCEIETVRYDPSCVPMIEEFAGADAIDAGERESVVARLPGAGAGRSLIFFAHPDSEPVTDLAGWTHPPFDGQIEEGRLYGWGVADDLAGVAAMIETLRAARRFGDRLAGDVVFASTPSKRHARGVSALLHDGLAADAAVYLHPAESGAGLREIKAFAAGQLEFRVTVEGAPPATTEPHQTAFAHLGVNPVDKMLPIVMALQALGERRAERLHHRLLEQAVGRSTNLMISHLSCGEADRLSRAAVRCMLGGAISFPPPEPLAAVREEVEAALAACAMQDAWLTSHPPTIVWEAGVSGAETPLDHALYRTAAAAVEAVCGAAPAVNPMHTSSDIRNPIVQKGIPTIGLGPLCGDLSQNGGHDEWVDWRDHLRCIDAATTILSDWCG